MPGMWKSHHRLMLGWLVVMQALFPGRKTLEELAHWTPGQITARRFRRLLNGAYWDVHQLNQATQHWYTGSTPAIPGER
jgi:hypothetical protein